MKPFTKKLPIIIDLQPEPQEVMLRLPEWMKYFFVLLYIATLTGLALLLQESFDEFKLYQETVQARRMTEDTVRQINTLQSKLAENKTIQREYELYKMRQKQITRPGPILEWIPSLISKTQRANTITLVQTGDSTSVRVTVEKPITEPIGRVSTAPPDYLLQSAGEETPKYNELPKGQKVNINNEFTALVIQLKKQ